MTLPTLDARPHARAIKEAVEASFGAAADLYDYDDVPGTNGNEGVLPDLYAEMTVEPVTSGNPRMTGQTGTRHWIATVRGVGRTVDEARWVLFKAATALHEQALVVDGRPTTPLQGGDGGPPELDGGRYSGLLVFTYTH